MTPVDLPAQRVGVATRSIVVSAKRGEETPAEDLSNRVDGAVLLLVYSATAGPSVGEVHARLLTLNHPERPASSWREFAASVFPRSRSMTADERAEFDAINQRHARKLSPQVRTRPSR